MILLPIIIIFFLFFKIQNISKSVDLKKSLLKTLYSIESQQRQQSLFENNVVSPFKIKNNTSFKNRIINLSRSNSISSQKIRIENFSQLQATSHLVQTEAKIKIKNFSTKDFSRFLTGLLKKEKIKILGIDVNTGPNEPIIKGSIDVVHFSITNK
jgi:hypothetical protein